jgi:hypothetical protein
MGLCWRSRHKEYRGSAGTLIYGGECQLQILAALSPNRPRQTGEQTDFDAGLGVVVKKGIPLQEIFQSLSCNITRGLTTRKRRRKNLLEYVSDHRARNLTSELRIRSRNFKKLNFDVGGCLCACVRVCMHACTSVDVYIRVLTYVTYESVNERLQACTHYMWIYACIFLLKSTVINLYDQATN